MRILGQYKIVFSLFCPCRRRCKRLGRSGPTCLLQVLKIVFSSKILTPTCRSWRKKYLTMIGVSLHPTFFLSWKSSLTSLVTTNLETGLGLKAEPTAHVSHIPSFDPVWQRHLSDPTWRLHVNQSPTDSAHDADSLFSSHKTQPPRIDSGAPSSQHTHHDASQPRRSATDSATQQFKRAASAGVGEFRMQVSAPELGSLRSIASQSARAPPPKVTSTNSPLARWDSDQDGSYFNLS